MRLQRELVRRSKVDGKPFYKHSVDLPGWKLGLDPIFTSDSLLNTKLMSAEAAGMTLFKGLDLPMSQDENQDILKRLGIEPSKIDYLGLFGTVKATRRPCEER